MAEDNGWECGGEKKGLTANQPLASALMWIECQESPSVMSAVTPGCRIRQTALPSPCSVTLGISLSEIQSKGKVTYIMGLW